MDALTLPADRCETTRLAAYPVSPECRAAFDAAEHVLIGLSPGNSYYSSEERIHRFAQWASQRFATLHFSVWGEPFVWSLLAVGFPADKAERYARTSARKLLNKAGRALAAVGVADPESRILTWPKLQQNPAFRHALAEVRARYQADAWFREACLEVCRDYLGSQPLVGDRPLAERTGHAVEYYLSELPLFVDTPALVGADSSVYCYHAINPFEQRLYQRSLPLLPAVGQGRLVLVDETAPA